MLKDGASAIYGSDAMAGVVNVILKKSQKGSVLHALRTMRDDLARLVHGVRQKDELAYHELLTEHLPQHEFLGEMISQQLLYYPTVTRESYRNMGRITELMGNGKIYTDLKLPPLSAEHDRVMICGSPGMLRDLKDMLNSTGFKEGNTSEPGDFVIERAFVEQ